MRLHTVYWVVTGICVILALTSLYFATRAYFQRRETFTNVSFSILSPTEVRDFIQNDGDGYIRSLTQPDLHARKCKTHDEYKSRVFESVATIVTDQQRELLEKAITTVNGFSKLAPLSSSKFHSIPWKVAVMEGNIYEEGLPHTRADIIFITRNMIEQSPSLASTLLHEKVHVYQRLYPEDIQTWMEKHGFVASARRNTQPLARSNPDLDDWIYTKSDTQTPMIAFYNSEKPAGITDVTLTNPAYEHPYELMAYQLAANLRA